jgi:2-(1,2-epoxy-1,2-dihydrophenyl)acetyl-CoA isomerase
VADLEGGFHGFAARIEAPGIAVVTFDRGERLNGLTLTMKRELVEWLAHAQANDGIRAVVITGEGRAFCAGDDISGKDDTDLRPPVLVKPIEMGQRAPIRVYNSLRHSSQPLAKMLRNFDKPTVAAVNGVAVQSGLTVALACDFRIASTKARFTSGTLRFAFTPDDGGHHLLVQHLGLAKALDFVMLNKMLDASEALAWGLVSEVVDAGSELDRALALATQLANGPQVAMRLVKRSLYNAADLTFDQALDDIASKTAVSDFHDDAHEGVAAFRDKRPPHFNAWLE